MQPESPTCVLIVDDDRELGSVLAERLGKRGYHVESVFDPAQAVARIQEDEFDVVVTDLRMPGMDGVVLCHRIHECRPGLPVVVLTGFGSLESAVDAIRAGAYDFVEKPVTIDLLQIAVDRAAGHRAAQREIRRLQEQIPHLGTDSGLLGESEAMRTVRDTIARVAGLETTVLITGETGTGKELAARAVHAMSSRSQRPLVGLNCTSVPENLFESELFGHARGAFTGARDQRAGLLQQARGGTLFLDEVGDLPAQMQPKLLRVLQEKTFRPVGSDSELPADVRVIAATNADIESAVEERRFREDLYYRLNVIRLELPPLRGRGSDVLLLAREFLERFALQLNKPVKGMATSVAEQLMTYDWPGNVRELQNCMERAVALAAFEELRIEDLPERVRSRRPGRIVVGEGPEELLPLRTIELRYVKHVFESVGRNKTAAARVLGLDRKTLHRKLEQCGVDESS
jgi:DNA-binding NtrC family response regulator